MKKIKVGLFGMYGLYNYGCEAIVRGTYELIKKSWPNSDVILYTYNAIEDSKTVRDLDINVKQIPEKNNLFIIRSINKLLRSISIHRQILTWDPELVAEECDLVFSVGGDIYTIPEYILNTKTEKKYNPIVEFGKCVVKKKPMIIWGASIGPFGEKESIKNYYFSHLKNVKQIFCREEKTYNYLKSNGIDMNVQLCSDPAFYTNSQTKSKRLGNGKIRIALNFSPLSIREQVGNNYNTFEGEIIDTIVDLLSIENSEIFLVPHVISPLSVDDNDLIYLQNIYKNIPAGYRNNINILENAKGFLGTKDFLKTCNLVIAARMHCAVNAISEGIPTIFLSYSQKGIGMARYIYGDDHWVVPLLNIREELRNKSIEMLKNEDDISIKINERVEIIRDEEARIIELFRKQMPF